MSVVVIGAGAWGTTLAGLAHRAGSDTTLVARNLDVFHALAETRRHPISLPGYVLPPDVALVRDVAEGIATEPDCVVVAVPSAAIGEVGSLLVASGYRGPIVTASKGIDPKTLKTPTERLADAIGCNARLGGLSGPNLAGEIAAGRLSLIHI